MARAATAAMKETAEIAKSKGRASIDAGRLSKKWQNALRANVYPAVASALAVRDRTHVIPVLPTRVGRLTSSKLAAS